MNQQLKINCAIKQKAMYAKGPLKKVQNAVYICITTREYCYICLNNLASHTYIFITNLKIVLIK